ncbi:hypothetical protein [Photobacterium sanguinicancri]|uniref:hypothetical protein n=1 Tax=Photobacterium sanguinicancri TaxID=875932 RepID=UPI003D0BE483
MNQYLQPSQRVEFHLIGEFLHVEACPDVVLIETMRGQYRLKQGAQIRAENLSGKVTVTNLSDKAGAVEIVSGSGSYSPPTEGRAVRVSQMPAVQVSQVPAIEVSQMPAVQVSQIPALEVSQMPAVQVSHLPAVEMKAGQVIPVTTVTAERLITNVLTLVDGKAIQASRSARSQVMVKAAKENKGIVLLGSYELESSEKITLPTTAALSFTGVDGDKIQLIEMVK